MSHLYSNSIFWVDVYKIKPNPYQPRREFNEAQLQDLSDSIRRYGVLQPLVVSRVEVPKEDGGLAVEYELIAGERRLRASKLAGVQQVPVVIRVGDDSLTKLELAIIENLQREDLNSVERARAFSRLVEEFKFTHSQIGAKVGKSREYVSNTLRLLALPQEVLDGLSAGKISEGHSRPILMLTDRPEEQMTLFKEIMFKKLSVRESERIARRIANDRVRKREYIIDPEIREMEEKLQKVLGTRVKVDRKETGGQITIDFFSSEDLDMIFELLKTNEIKKPTEMMERFIALQEQNLEESNSAKNENENENVELEIGEIIEEGAPIDDRVEEEIKKAEEDADLYNLKNFSI